MNFKQIFSGLAIVTVFSTVAVERVFAEDRQIITNVTYSSHTTGGIQTQGQDGADGVAGQDGQDGQQGEDGSPGKSGSNVVTGDSNSTVLPHTDSEVPAVAGTPTATVATIERAQEESDSNAQGRLFLTLQLALFSLQIMFVTYVSELF